MDFKKDMDVVCIRKQPWRILTPSDPPPEIKYGDVVTISNLIRKDILFLEFQQYPMSLYGAGNFVPLDLFVGEFNLEKEEVLVG
jgi:hypothetical protein